MHKPFSFLISFCIAGISFSFGGELEKKIGGEIGYFKTNNISNLNRDNVIAAFSGLIKWNHLQKNNRWLLQVRFRPEYFGVREPTWVFPTAFSGQFKHSGKAWEAGLDVSLRKQNYYRHANNLFYNFVIVNPEFTWHADERWAAEIQSSYFIRTLRGAQQNNFYSESVSGKSIFQYSLYGFVYGGGYAELFRFKNFDVLQNQDRGWRAGPQCGFEYSRHFIINGSYQLLSRHLNSHAKHSVENHVTVLIGKNLSRKWSVFLYLDYVNNRVSLDEKDSLFTDVKNVSLMTFKFIYHQAQNLDVFFKVNYLSNQVINVEQTFTGARITAGVELRH